MKIGWLEFWVCALATYRITVLISRDLGPFEVFKRMRGSFHFGKLLKCPFCVSVYVGGAIAFGLLIAGYVEPWSMWIMIALAFSGVSIALDRTFSVDVHND